MSEGGRDVKLRGFYVFWMQSATVYHHLSPEMGVTDIGGLKIANSLTVAITYELQ